LLIFLRSPWWLLSKGKEAAAAKALKQLGYSSNDIDKRMAAITLTLEEVRRETDGASFIECFKKSNLRRTMISVAPLSIQALSGVCMFSLPNKNKASPADISSLYERV
jgi:SP family general alpha glucoside:H+ symporter-like MFS transporter